MANVLLDFWLILIRARRVAWMLAHRDSSPLSQCFLSSESFSICFLSAYLRSFLDARCSTQLWVTFPLSRDCGRMYYCFPLPMKSQQRKPFRFCISKRGTLCPKWSPNDLDTASNLSIENKSYVDSKIYLDDRNSHSQSICYHRGWDLVAWKSWVTNWSERLWRVQRCHYLACCTAWFESELSTILFALQDRNYSIRITDSRYNLSSDFRIV
jgi:hypothetical protein